MGLIVHQPLAFMSPSSGPVVTIPNAAGLNGELQTLRGVRGRKTRNKKIIKNGDTGLLDGFQANKRGNICPWRNLDLILFGQKTRFDSDVMFFSYYEKFDKCN